MFASVDRERAGVVSPSLDESLTKEVERVVGDANIGGCLECLDADAVDVMLLPSVTVPEKRR